MIILSIIFIQYKSLSDQNLKMFTFFISEPLKGDNVTDGRFEHYPRTSFLPSSDHFTIIFKKAIGLYSPLSSE